MTKVMGSKVNIPPIKIHSPMKMMKYNLNKDFKWSKVEQGGARWRTRTTCARSRAW